MDKPNEHEIYEALDKCAESEENGSSFPGMSYEQGVRDAIEWMNGNEDNPFEE